MDFDLRRNSLKNKIVGSLPSHDSSLILEVFHFQAAFNKTYADFINLLGINPLNITSVEEIPFLPVQLFKKHEIKTGAWIPEEVFTSSTTSGQTPSCHFVRERDFYLDNTVRGFEGYFGEIKDMVILALLPSYLEREGSSLIAMANHFIRISSYPESGFFLYNLGELAKTLVSLEKREVPTLLLGVSFALLDFSRNYPIPLKRTMVMETGGMKGRQKEITREDLHKQLCEAFKVGKIHSEYGMTELFSQAYSRGNGLFQTTPTMKIDIFEINDPLTRRPQGKPGTICVTDLANIDTCSFVATEDIGVVHADGSFEVLGRLDNSEMRGCNLMSE